ncbi:hypothetical protein DPEC_G00326400 [Dallia pectoralis]|uniref:Uncharacterized protein n=1 Tax=Dallia pectoralis TaxID=75939 RepID=A0ACC2F7U5_DALPE|nr:hypothetical protein DPEC_G00326400 [Dallia pectoralis]
MDSYVDYTCEEKAVTQRSGHVATVEGNTLFVWGGYMSTAGRDVFVTNDEIWVYDMKSGVWEMHQMTGEVPPPMSGACGSSLSGCLYIFGGYDETGQTNELYCVNLLDGNYSWRKVSVNTGTPPSPRDKLCCWVFNNRLTYFGGYGHKKLDNIRDDQSFTMDTASLEMDVGWGWNNDLHVFDTVLASWTEPNARGRAPSPRAAHAGTVLGHTGYVHGGRGMYTTTRDFHCLDLRSWAWSELVPVSSVPAGRSWHSLTTVSEKTMFLFGGMNVDCKPMSDGWIFDVDMKTWTEFKHRNEKKPRFWHSSCQTTDSDVVVFGGSCEYIHLVGTYENLTVLR